MSKTFNVLGKNVTFKDEEKLYIDIKNKKPFKAIIYDKNNAEKLNIGYSEFIKGN